MNRDEQGKAEMHAEKMNEWGQWKLEFGEPYATYEVTMTHTLVITRTVKTIATGFTDAEERVAKGWIKYPTNERQREAISVNQPDPVKFKVRKLTE